MSNFIQSHQRYFIYICVFDKANGDVLYLDNLTIFNLLAKCGKIHDPPMYVKIIVKFVLKSIDGCHKNIWTKVRC